MFDFKFGRVKIKGVSGSDKTDETDNPD